MKITANQVTITRILLLPIPAYMLLSENQTLIWCGFAIATVLGLTDALDGYMARRDGPTVLGGLLDPVADKVFVATFLLPIVGLGHCPWWFAGLIFVRELVITSLRSSMAARKTKLTTSKLGKIKTIAQMGGLALYLVVVQAPEPASYFVHIGGVAGLVLFTLLFYAVKRRGPPFWVIPSIPLWGAVLVMDYYLTDQRAIFYMFASMVVLTWVSGLDYLVDSGRVLFKIGVKRLDIARLFWSVTQGMAPVLVAAYHPKAAIPVLFGLAFVLGVGGIDNIASAQRSTPIRAFLLLTSIVAVGVGALGPVLTLLERPYPFWMAIVAAMVLNVANLISLVRAFVQNKEVFKEAS